MMGLRGAILFSGVRRIVELQKGFDLESQAVSSPQASADRRPAWRAEIENPRNRSLAFEVSGIAGAECTTGSAVLARLCQ